MDGNRFDKLTRTMASCSSRRSVVKSLLGLGGAAAASTLIPDSSVARRSSGGARSTPARCPDQLACGTFCCDTCNAFDNGCCDAGTSACTTNSTGCCSICEGESPITCGYECCTRPEECCDGECCSPGYDCLTYHFPEGALVQEETCCRNDLICDTATTKCCNNDERCCIRDGISYCIPIDGCCFTEECPQPDNQCFDPFCPVGVWECGGTTVGSNPVTCPPPINECFTVGICDPDTGVCPQQYRGDGASCDGGQGSCQMEVCCTPNCTDLTCRVLLSNGTCALPCGETAGNGCFDLVDRSCNACGRSADSDDGGIFVCIDLSFYNGDCVDECPVGNVCVMRGCYPPC